MDESVSDAVEDSLVLNVLVNAVKDDTPDPAL